MSFEGRVCVITGGGSGIGEACAIAFAEDGGNVVVGDRDLAAAQRVAAEIAARGAQAVAVECDVTDEPSVSAMVAAAVSRFGRLDCAVNAAGFMNPPQEVAEATAEVWSAQLGVHIMGTTFAMKHEIRAIRETSGRGSIVNMSSRGGRDGQRMAASYVAGKWAIIGITKSAALECAAQDIRVNVICPGLIDTPMSRKLIGADPSTVAKAPLGRAGRPSEIADAAMWLLSERSSYVTGADINVDGGLLAGPAQVSQTIANFKG